MAEKYKDSNRPILLAEIEVVNRDCKELVLPQVYNTDAINISHAGQTERFLVYEDHVAQVEDMVEKEPELIEAARKNYELKIADELAREGKILKGTKYEDIDWKNPDVIHYMKQSVRTLQSTFHDLYMRDIKPLVSCKVLKTGIIPTLKEDPLAKYRTPPVTQNITPELLAQAVMIVRQMEKQTAQPQPQQNQQNRR